MRPQRPLKRNGIYIPGGARDLVLISGLIKTDSSGDPTNSNTSPPANQYADAEMSLTYPAGISSVTRPRLGIYKFVLDTDYDSVWLESWDARPWIPNLQGEVIGTVDLYALETAGTLSATLDGTTLKITTSGSGGEQTVTFATPATCADVASQINAGTNLSDSAEILTHVSSTGTTTKYLRVFDKVVGATSTVTVNSTSTGEALVGLATTAHAGQDGGTFVLRNWNTRNAYWGGGTAGAGGTDAYIRQPVTFELGYVSTAGVGLNVVSGGIHFWFLLRVGAAVNL